MLISIRHITRYVYTEPATYSIQAWRLMPASYQAQRVLDWDVRTPGVSSILEFKDGFGNAVQLVTISGVHSEVVVEAAGSVETQDCSGVVAGLSETSPPRVFLKETPQTEPDEAIRQLARSVSGVDMLARLHALAEAVRERVDYRIGMTDVHTSAAAALADGHGVCQDHAHIFIAAARTLAVPARYVTGYLVMDVPAPAEAHHAWAEAWVEGLGWVGFDIANRICPTERYVRLAAGLDAGQAAPIIGSRRGGGEEELHVSVAAHRQQSQSQSQS
jgi:transglutaminase-like putative cysteine protease